MKPRAYIKKGPEVLLPKVVKANSTVGAHAAIVCGNTIGRFAFVGADSVVIRDIDDYAFVVGNPAHQIDWICECTEKLPIKAISTIGEECRCGACGAAFVREATGLVRS